MLLLECTVQYTLWTERTMCGAHFTKILGIAMHLKCISVSGKVAHFENCINEVRSRRGGLRVTALQMSLTVIRPC